MKDGHEMEDRIFCKSLPSVHWDSSPVSSPYEALLANRLDNPLGIPDPYTPLRDSQNSFLNRPRGFGSQPTLPGIQIRDAAADQDFEISVRRHAPGERG